MMNDYQKSIVVSKPTSEVYKALTQHIADWWSDDILGASAEEGDRFDIAFGETKKTFEIAEVIQERQVTWLCRKAYIDMETLTRRDEWVGTRIIWTIDTNAENTTLSLLHQGLNKGIECYDVCEPAWDYFLASIQAFLNNGTGTPYHKKVAKLEWENQ